MTPGMATGAGGRPGGEHDLEALERAMAALEAQRGVLGDDVVDTALAPLHERRARLLSEGRGEQRRLVTVVFADLVGFTDMSGFLDPEDTREVMDAYFARWRSAIEAHQGVVEKFIGDAVMAVFGLQQSWEDDAQRAVRAALSMVADLEELNREVGRRYGVTLRMRVGIDTGDVVVSTLGDRGETERGAFVAVGPTVNRAARLQAAAPVDRVMISSETHRQVRGRFSMERVDGLVLKGFDEPVTGYVVVSERAHGYQLDRSAGVEGVETTTVGRELELRALKERLLDVVDESRWQVVTVLGEAGVGKSRLLFDFDSWLAESRDRFYWYRGRASQSDHNRANGLLRDLVASRCRIADTDSAAEVLAKLQSGLAPEGRAERSHDEASVLGAWLGFDLGELPASVPSDPQALRDAGTTLLAEYFAERSRRYPVVILLEDLHWADDGSLRWLDAADVTLADSRVLVVATSRPALLEVRPHWSEGLVHHSRVVVGPLSRRQSRQLLLQVFRHVDVLPDELVDLVIDSADGNPFYLEELVTWLIDAGVVVKGDPTWRVVQELVGAVVVPSTLRGVLQARLDALTTHERSLLQRASVVGRVFWDEAVTRLADRPDAESGRTADALDGLRRRELVLEREVSAFEAAREFLFKHALLRDVAYEGVLRKHRERYHRLAAEWLADISTRSGRADEYAVLIAHHHDRAGSPEAGAWYFRAGRRAADVYALDEATRLLGRALDLMPDDPARRFDVLRLRDTVWDRLGDRELQRLDIVEMDQLLDRLGDDRVREVHLALAHCRLDFTTSSYDAAEEWADRAMRTAGDDPALAREVVEAHLWHGKSQTWRDHAVPAQDSLTRAIELGRAAGLPRLVGEALRYLCMLASNEGRFPEAVAYGAESAQAFRSDGDFEGEAMALAQQATAFFNMGRLDDARETLQRTLPVFRRSGHRYRESIVLANLASIAVTQGRFADASAWGGEARDIQRSLGDKEATATNLMLLGQVAISTGDWTEAERVLDDALALAVELEARQTEMFTLTLRSLLAVERGAVDRALEPAREAVELSELLTSPLNRGYALLALGYAEHGTGNHTAAVTAFEEAEQQLSEVEGAVLAREALAGRAVALLDHGDVGAAVPLALALVPHLDREGLDGALRPTAVLAAVWRVLEAAGDAGAADSLEAATAYVDDTADRIGDERMRAGYLRVPVNAALLSARSSR